MPIHILITGANTGIGYATAKLLASIPDHHIILACRDRLKGEAAVQDLEKTSTFPISVSTLHIDVNDAKSIESAAKATAAQFGKLDILINNAGIYNPQHNLETELADSFRTNVIGPALMTEHFKPLLLKAPNPYLLHIGSALGSLTLTADSNKLDSSLKCPGYKTSKAALAMLSIMHAGELGPQGIKVFLVHPGLIESGLRGPDENARTAGGRALKPVAAAGFIEDILSGKRDKDVGKCAHKDGIWPW